MRKAYFPALATSPSLFIRVRFFPALATSPSLFIRVRLLKSTVLVFLLKAGFKFNIA